MGGGGEGAIVAPGLNPICPSLHRNGGHQSAAESKVVMWVLSSAPWHRVLKRCQPFTVPLAVFSTTFRLKAPSFSEHDSRVGELIGTIWIRPGRSDRLISIGVSFTHRKRESLRFVLFLTLLYGRSLPFLCIESTLTDLLLACTRSEFRMGAKVTRPSLSRR